MANEGKPEFTTEPGRVICKNGEPHLLIAVTSAFFSGAASATQEEADELTLRIVDLLNRHGAR